MKVLDNPFVTTELQELTTEQLQHVNGGGFEILIEILKDWILSNQPTL